MASDSLVTAKHILHATREVQWVGAEALKNLEETEPELASWLIENLSLIDRQFVRLHLPPNKCRRLNARIEAVVMTCITAMRIAHRDLWDRGPGKAFDDEPPPS